jgi:hypothetical protein
MQRPDKTLWRRGFRPEAYQAMSPHFGAASSAAPVRQRHLQVAQTRPRGLHLHLDDPAVSHRLHHEALDDVPADRPKRAHVAVAHAVQCADAEPSDPAGKDLMAPGSRSPRVRDARTRSYLPSSRGCTISPIKSPRSAPSPSMKAITRLLVTSERWAIRRLVISQSSQSSTQGARRVQAAKQSRPADMKSVKRSESSRHPGCNRRR